MRTDYQSRRVIETPLPSGVYSGSGSTGPMKGYAPFNSILAQLEVVSAPAPSGTLDITVEHSLDGNNWFPIPFNNGGNFQEITAPSTQVCYRNDGMFFDQIRVRWDISAGTQFTFNVKWQLGL
jgi:hypothetical protein